MNTYLCKKSKSSFLGDILEGITLKYQYEKEEKEKIETEREVFLKKKAEMISALNVLQFLEEIYSLHSDEAEKIKDFLRYYNKKFKKIFADEIEQFENGTGQIKKINVLAIFNGFALIENFTYRQYKHKGFSSSRRKYFVVGFEDGFFAHPISKSCAEDILEEKNSKNPDPYRVWFKWMFDVEPHPEQLRQGDILFIPVETELTNIKKRIRIGKHIIVGNIMNNYVSNFYAWHPHHKLISDFTGKTYWIKRAFKYSGREID